MRNRTLAVLVGFALLATAIGGIAQAEKVKLTWTTCCAQTERHELFQEIARQYMELHPDVEVEWRYPSGRYYAQLTTLFAAGSAPDVMWLGTGIWNFTDLLMPLNEIAAKDAGAKAVNPALMRLVNFDGNQVAIPYAASAHTMFYNKDHFANAGLGAPPEGWTFDDMIEDAKRLTVDTDGDKAPDQWGLSYWDSYVAMHWGGNFYTPDKRKTQIDSPANIAAMQFFADLYSGKLDYATRDTQAFRSGDASMRNIGIFDVPSLRSNATFDWDVTDMPAFVFEGKEYRNTYVSLESWSINKATAYPEQAKDFVRFLLSSDVMEQIARAGIAIPAQRRMATAFIQSEPPPANMMAFIRALDYGPELIAFHPAGDGLWQWISSQSAWTEMMSGTRPAASALPELAVGINQYLDEFWAGKDSN